MYDPRPVLVVLGLYMLQIHSHSIPIDLEQISLSSLLFQEKEPLKIILLKEVHKVQECKHGYKQNVCFKS